MGKKFETVISGVSGRFPDCESVPEFRSKLYAGRSFMSTQDNKWPVNYRYKYDTDVVLPSATGKLKYITEYDPVVFKMNNAVAECTDVLNRKVLQPSLEAVMDAGLNPYDLQGRHIGVYMTFDRSDCDSNSTATRGGGRLWVLGSSKTMMANRVSFALDLTGPSFTFSNDIFGNLTALHEAYKNVSEGYVEAAIVGVAAAVQHPIFGMNLSKMNVLSMDAVTRVFDKNANGYARSDAVVVLFIQRASEAKRIYASIDFTGYTYFGSNPNSFLNFNEDQLKKSATHLYKNRNEYELVKDVSFMELSACGLKNYDKIESNFIADVFCQERTSPLLVGSVKSNMGHSDGAAPYVSLIKALFALESGIIVQNQNLDQVNDEIRAFKDSKLKVVTKPTALINDRILVNSVGIIGVLSQVVLRRNPKERKLQPVSKEDLPRLTVMCTRTEDGIRNILRKLEMMPFDAEFISLVNDVFGTDMPYHVFRGFTILSPDPNLIKKNMSDTKGNKNRPVWFLFSGMGSQWNKMGEGLLRLPIIEEAVKKCDDVLKNVGVDIYRILTSDDPSIFDNIMHSFVGIITIQIALVEVLKALGINPDGIIGHSVGENACAYADGCLTLEQAVLSSYARGMASLETKTTKGMMAAVGKGYNEIKNMLPANIEVACHNSATSCTLSGPAEDVENYVERLREENIFARAVNVANIAYHSKHIAPAAPNLLSRLQQIISKPKKRSSKWISTSVPESKWNTPLAQRCSAEYLTNNLLNSVLFEEGTKHIPADALVIEIAPHGLLQAIVKRSLPLTCANIALTRKNSEAKNLENLLNAIGRLYIAGCDVKVNALYPSIEYPVPRETSSVAPLANWLHSAPDAGLCRFDPVGSHNGDPIVIRANDDSPYYYLKDHQINNRIVLPTSFYLYLTWWVYCINRDIVLGSHPVIFEDIELFKNTSISLSKSRKLTVFIQKGSGKFEIFKRKKSSSKKTTKIMSGILHQSAQVSRHVVNPKEVGNIEFTISQEQFYRVFKDSGYQLRGTFHNVTELKCNENDSYAKITWRKNWVSFLDSLMKFSMFSEMENKTDLFYSYKIRKLEISAEEFSSIEEGTTLLCHKDRRTNIITCKGLAMYAVGNKRFVLKNQNTNVKLQGLRFVSHQNPRCQNVAEFFKFCLHITIGNIGVMFEKNNAKLNVIAESDEKISNLMKHIVKNSSALKGKVLFYKPKETVINKCSLTNECCMLVTDTFQNIGKHGVDYSFLLVEILDDRCVPRPTIILDHFLQITQQKFADGRFCFFKKKSSVFQEPLRMENEEWSANLPLESHKSEPTFVVQQSTDYTDLSLMLDDCRKPSDPRYMFVMDKEIPSYNTLESQQSLDLPVSVLQNGEWGSYQNICENLSEVHEDTERSKDLMGDIRMESIHLQYIGCDKEFEFDGGSQVYGIEYSGVEDTGQRVMGLASVDSYNPMSHPDPILSWKVPMKWSQEDAVTVPFIYSQAYRILDSHLICGIHYISSILINVGDEGALCEACISISLSRNYTVFITVSSHEEAVFLKKKFPKFDDEHILVFNSQECSFQKEILKITKGFGVNLVVNCLPGIQSVQESLNCLCDLGYLIQIGKTKHWENEKLELYPFLKSISFIPIQNKISSLLKLPADEKQNLKMLVEDGIKSGIVVSFDRNVRIQGIPQNTIHCCKNSYMKTIYEWFPNNETSFNANQKITYDNNRSYIIFDGEKRKTRWFELVEWLISKGARKFVVGVDNFFLGPSMFHRMNRLLVQKQATIVFSSTKKTETVHDAENLIYDASKIGPLEAVFFVSVASAGKKIYNMDVAARKYNPNIHFISMFSGGLKECELRRFAGSPAVVIHDSNFPRKLSTVLPQIDLVLSRFDNCNSPTLYRLTNIENKTVDSPLRGYLPHDLDTLETIADGLSDKFDFVEVTTKAPRYSTLKDCSPIFIISTLGPKPLRGLLSNLMSPAFCTSIGPYADSAIEMASKLYESANSIQSKGGVTILSETWSSPIAFEMVKLLERDNRKFRLIIMDGNPLIWKRRIASLGPIGSSQFENNLIAHLLNIASEIRLENLSELKKPLPKKLLDFLRYRGDNLPANISQLTDVIRKAFEIVSNYEYNNQLLKNTVLMERNFCEKYPLNISVTSEVFVYEAEDYSKFLTNREVCNKINSNVLYTLWYD